jgi:hypothetical protein
MITARNFIIFQMELAKKFKEASDCQLLRIDQLILNREHSVTRAVRLSGCVIFFLRDTQDYVSHLYKLYLPLQYADVVSERDIHQISNDNVWISLMYKDLGRDGTPILEVT